MLRFLLDKNNRPIAQWFPASRESVDRVLAKPTGDDGRTEFVWVRLINGDLVLGVFPVGEGYLDIQEAVGQDHATARAARQAYFDSQQSSEEVPP